MGVSGGLLFVSTNYSSFVRQDAEMLSQDWDVHRFEFGSQKGFAMLSAQLKLFVWILLRVVKAKVIFVWFVDYHAFFPTLLGRIFGKKVVLVLGGYDVACMPEYNYGGHVKPVRSWIIRKCCRWASQLLPVSEFVEARLGQLRGASGFARSTVVYNGVDLELFPLDHKMVDTPRRGVICVGLAESVSRVYIKGLDRFAEVARSIPDTQFTIIGCKGAAEDYLRGLGVANLLLLPPVPRVELLRYYAEAQAICQFSRFESFGMALAEGMLCGCLPVTIAGLGAAEVVSVDSGCVAHDDGLPSLVAATLAALDAGAAMRASAMDRVRNEFSLTKRGELLKKALS